MARSVQKKGSAARTARRGQSRVTENPALVGLNLYTDPKGRLVYIQPFTKKAVYVAAYDQKKFIMYKRRYLVVLAALILLWTVLVSMFEISFWIPAVLCVLLWAGLEFSFSKFLGTMQPVKKLRMEDLTPTYEAQISEDEKKKYWVRAGLYMLLGVMLVMNAYQQQYDGFTMFFCWAACLFCVGCGIYQMYIISRFTRKKPAAQSAAGK